MAQEDKKSKIIERAWKEAAFKKKLVTNPKAALQEMGVHVPDNVEVRIVEEQANSFTFVLPRSPAKLQQLSDAELKKMAAAAADPLLCPSSFCSMWESPGKR